MGAALAPSGNVVFGPLDSAHVGLLDTKAQWVEARVRAQRPLITAPDATDQTNATRIFDAPRQLAPCIFPRDEAPSRKLAGHTVGAWQGTFSHRPHLGYFFK